MSVLSSFIIHVLISLIHSLSSVFLVFFCCYFSFHSLFLFFLVVFDPSNFIPALSIIFLHLPPFFSLSFCRLFLLSFTLSLSFSPFFLLPFSLSPFFSPSFCLHYILYISLALSLRSCIIPSDVLFYSSLFFLTYYIYIYIIFILTACVPAGFHDSSSSSGIMEYSPLSSPRDSMVASPITIKRGKKGYGLTFKSIRVYIGDTNDYRIHHIIDVSTSPWVFFSFDIG